MPTPRWQPGAREAAYHYALDVMIIHRSPNYEVAITDALNKYAPRALTQRQYALFSCAVKREYAAFAKANNY